MKPVSPTLLSLLLAFLLSVSPSSQSILPWQPAPFPALAASGKPSAHNLSINKLPSGLLSPTTPDLTDQPGDAVLANADAWGEPSMPTAASGPDVAAPSALLMEASTGQVLYEKNADEPRSPASITKIMTLILIFDALESGKIQMNDSVTTSAYAKSMGGSQVFLEEGEVQTVETLIKCIVIASGNDASVAMAEYIAGSEAEFVSMMNDRAAGLGMTNTHFEDCCGLTDSPSHVTTARDIALMSRELINHYPQIHNYSTIWMDTITHVTKQGTKEFGLSNTNKLLKMATNFNVTGLKTGSTSLAKYCFSGTAEKDGVRLIASIMAAPDYKARFQDALALLNYGFANCRLYQDAEMLPLPQIPVKNGKEDSVPLTYDGAFSYLSLTGEDFTAIEKELVLQEYAEAPVKAGDQAGWLNYRLNGTQIGQVPVRYQRDVEKATFADYWKGLLHTWLLETS
ncbi:MAG: D-alanyl-D-alanine carboxypeptidase family protein [Lachnospiraceae bacterium]|nr:D-alanyl-D-alanine carboxypeptidase family protein [Lachnospiraceae bacterium]